MKFFLLCLFSSISVFSFSHVYATEYYQTWWNLINDKCLTSENYHFTHIYHEEIPEKVLNEWVSSFLKDRCYLFIFWVDVKNTTGSLIPVYQPWSGVIGFYSIYSGRNLSGDEFIGFFLSKIVSWSKTPYYYGSFGWRLSLWTIGRKGDAYFASLKPPFSTAYMTQWYSYLWRPLLVARDKTWLTTDVFIQNPLSNKNQKDLAKKYLWEKWYHP